MDTKYNLTNITPNTIIFFESGNIFLSKKNNVFAFEINELINVDLDDVTVSDLIADNYYTNIVIWKNIDYKITEDTIKFDKLYIMKSAMITIDNAGISCMNSSTITHLSQLSDEQINARNTRIENDKSKIPYYFKPAKKTKFNC
jgi:hypothetical protein